MKLAPFFYSKESLVKKINKRNAKRIQEYTYVSPQISKDMHEKINQNIDSIARYAARKKCNLSFVPAADLFQKSTQMNVYKRSLNIILSNQLHPVMAQSTRWTTSL